MDVELLRGEIAEAAGSGDALLIAADVLGRRVLGGDIEAPVVFAQDEIDDAADGVAAVDRRRPVLEHLDPIDRREGNRIEILTARREGMVSYAAAVDQHDGELKAESPQRPAREAEAIAATAAAETLRHIERAIARRCGDAVDQLGSGLEVRALDLVTRDDLDRQAGLALDSRDVASRHEDPDVSLRGIPVVGDLLAERRHRQPGDGTCRPECELHARRNAFQACLTVVRGVRIDRRT